MNKQLIYNPFIKIAGIKSLIIGFLGLMIIALLAYITGTHMNGLIFRFAKDSDFWIYIIEILFHWIILSTILYISGLILSRSRIRFIDIFGTILFSKIPLVITPLIRLIPRFNSFYIFSLSTYILITVYLISLSFNLVLMINAYRITCNLKDEKLIISFVIGLILAEILTKFLFIKII